jgi:hypothetical protein
MILMMPPHLEPEVALRAAFGGLASASAPAMRPAIRLRLNLVEMPHQLKSLYGTTHNLTIVHIFAIERRVDREKAGVS